MMTYVDLLELQCFVEYKIKAEFYVSGKYFKIISGKRSMKANWESAIIA